MKNTKDLVSEEEFDARLRGLGLNPYAAKDLWLFNQMLKRFVKDLARQGFRAGNGRVCG